MHVLLVTAVGEKKNDEKHLTLLRHVKSYRAFKIRILQLLTIFMNSCKLLSAEIVLPCFCSKPMRVCDY